jgi:TonB family protein
LSIGDRCILSLQQFEYPQKAHQRGVVGTVTVAKVADRNGKVTAKVVKQADDVSLTQAAPQNVSTWWIEAAPREDSFQTTFTYELDATLAPGEVDLEIDLPTTVTIRASPEK